MKIDCNATMESNHLNSVNEIRAEMPGTTVVQKLNQGITRLPIAIGMGVLFFGGPFLVPFWPNKKVQKRIE
jgi:hypothetical protein